MCLAQLKIVAKVYLFLVQNPCWSSATKGSNYCVKKNAWHKYICTLNVSVNLPFAPSFDFLFSLSPPVSFVDYQMPRCNTFQFCKELV